MTDMPLNRQWRIATRPVGRMVEESDFAWREEPARAPGAGELLLKTVYLGFDPSQKGQMENRANYAAPLEIGDVMRSRGIGEVLLSNDPGFKPGDMVSGSIGWQTHPTVRAADMLKVANDELLSGNLGVLGSTGLTALFGMKHVGVPFPGDTVVVTGAAGATGSVAGQIAKMAGCRVIGIAGGPQKCAWLTDELGFDHAIDYRQGDVRGQLKPLVPDGVDVLWDNVGGEQLNDILNFIALNARVVICGGIARYSTAEMPAGPENYFNLVFMRATMRGFLLGDYTPHFPWGRERLKSWIRAGKLKHAEDVQHGFENAPKTMRRLFEGANLGKQVLKV
jgi:NADPH-dependent curcumin reductase CurA